MNEVVNYLNIEQDVFCLESIGTIVNISAEFETAVEKVQQSGKEALDNISAQVSHVDEQVAAAETSAVKAENTLNEAVSVIEHEAAIAIKGIETQEKASVQVVLGSETKALSNIQNAVEQGKEVLNLLTEEKTTKFNANAIEKTATYDTNHNEKLEIISDKVSEATMQANNAATSAEEAENSKNIAQHYAEESSRGNIGDIKHTSSAIVPPGGAWCDGSSYTQAQFPDVYQMLIESKLKNVDFASYEEQIAAIGQCGYFGLDQETKTFKVPLLKDVFIKTDPEITFRIYVVLYTVATPVSEAQAAQFLNGLSSKADKDLRNVTDWTAAANQVYPGSKKFYNFLTVGGEAWTSPAPGWLKITYKASRTGTALTSISGEFYATPIYAVGAMHTSIFPVNTGDVITVTLQDGNLIVHESVFTYAKGC